MNAPVETSTGTVKAGGCASLRPQPPVPQRPASRAIRIACGLLVGLCLAGCHIAALTGQKPVTRPTKYSVRGEQLLLLSDFKIAADHPLVRELGLLRRQIGQTLDLPLGTEPIVVYVFEDELTYRQYLDANYKDLPARRAYFIGTPNKLKVFTFWGEKIQEDLRHEYTHGLLHASLKTVPLWLDEGLAEYFEVAGPAPGSVNVEYAHRLAEALAGGWRPDIERLERIEEFEQLERADYQEAWAWVHFLMHSGPETKDILLAYLRDLRTETQPQPLSARLQHELPQFRERFVSYVASLHSSRPWLGARDEAPSTATRAERG